MSAFGRYFLPPLFLPALRAVFIGYRLFLGVFYGLIGIPIGSAVIGVFCMWFCLFFLGVLLRVCFATSPPAQKPLGKGRGKQG